MFTRKRKMMVKPLVVPACLMLMAHAGSAAGAVITFDDIPAGTEYESGTTFTAGGVDITVSGGTTGRVVPVAPGSPSTPLISARILPRPVDPPGEGFVGNQLSITSLAQVDFNFGGSVEGLVFEMSSIYGVNLIVNGESIPDEPIQVHDTGDGFLANWSMGGVQVRQVDVSGGKGTTTLVGHIESFSIIGVGSSVDTFVVSEATPEPGSLSLILIGGGLLVRRRRS